MSELIGHYPEGKKAIARFTRDAKYDGMLRFDDKKSNKLYWVWDNPDGSPHNIGISDSRFIRQPILSTIGFNILQGYLDYYPDRAPTIWIAQIPNVLTVDHGVYAYLNEVYYAEDGSLQAPFMQYKESDKHKAERLRKSLPNLGFYQENEMPPQIDMKRTIEALVAQIGRSDFSKPALLPSYVSGYQV